MNYARRKDKNQAEIVNALRQCGCTVEVLHEPADLLVGYRGSNSILEVKDKGGKLTKAQRNWHATWNGSAHVVRSIDEALRAVGILRAAA
jgi:hypothetical protein